VTTVPNPFASEKEEEKCATWNKVGVKNILASMLNSQSKKYANNNLTPTNKEGQGNYEETPAEIKMEAAGGYALTKASRVMITSFKYSTTSVSCSFTASIADSCNESMAVQQRRCMVSIVCSIGKTMA
jgi:hypothetical protein